MKKMDEIKELSADEYEDLIKHNKYLSGQKIYDFHEILVEGKFPDLPNAVDKVKCMIELGDFIEKNGLCKQEENFVEFFRSLDKEYRVICLRRIRLERLEQMLRNPKLTLWLREMMRGELYE